MIQFKYQETPELVKEGLIKELRVPTGDGKAIITDIYDPNLERMSVTWLKPNNKEEKKNTPGWRGQPHYKT